MYTYVIYFYGIMRTSVYLIFMMYFKQYSIYVAAVLIQASLLNVPERYILYSTP